MDAWTSGGAYESYIGRWSREVAREFVGWLAPPPGLRWLDVGCGTGALSATLLELAAPAAVLGVDPSSDYLAYAREQVRDERVTLETGSAMALPLPDESVDAVASGLVLNFVPEPGVALAEMRRVVRPGGTVAVYVWDYAGEMQLINRFWRAAGELDPRARELDEGVRFPICRPDALERLFRDAGLGEVEVRAIDVPTVFTSFDDFWRPFLSGQGPAPGYVASLPEEGRAALAARLRDSLPVAEDGSIALIARGWAVKAVR